MSDSRPKRRRILPSKLNNYQVGDQSYSDSEEKNVDGTSDESFIGFPSVANINTDNFPKPPNVDSIVDSENYNFELDEDNANTKPVTLEQQQNDDKLHSLILTDKNLNRYKKGFLKKGINGKSELFLFPNKKIYNNKQLKRKLNLVELLTELLKRTDGTIDDDYPKTSEEAVNPARPAVIGNIIKNENLIKGYSGDRVSSDSLYWIIYVQAEKHGWAREQGNLTCSSDATCFLWLLTKLFQQLKLPVEINEYTKAVNFLNYFVGAYLFPKTVSVTSEEKWRKQLISDLGSQWEIFASEKKNQYKFGLSDIKKRNKNLAQSQGQSERNADPTSFMEEDILAMVNTLIESESALDKVLLVQLCCGSRFIEVLKISNYFLPSEVNVDVSKIPGVVADNGIVIIGVAKDKNKDINNDEDETGNTVQVSERQLPVKPVIFGLSPIQIKYLVYDIIRPALSVQNLSNAQATNKYNSKAIARIRSFKGMDKHDKKNRLGTHVLRKIYANYSYDNYSLKDISRNAWITKVLGHEPTSVTTSLSYTTASIIQMPRFTDGNMRESIVLLSTKLNSAISKITDLEFKLTQNQINSGMVTFETINGDKSVSIARPQGSGNRIVKCMEKVEELNENSVKPTYFNLRQLGFSNEIAKKAKDLMKQNEMEEPI